MVAQHHDVQPPTAVPVDQTDAARISVTELPDTLFGNVIEAYSHHSFERGYQVAVTELMASVLPATEAFLREQPVTPELREALYRFERFLARRFDTTVRADHSFQHIGILSLEFHVDKLSRPLL